ncbi:hypothetical protein ACF0H5_014137 [Mactra antiquata]
MSEDYKLLYFNKRGGGEIIRLVFAATNTKYEDCRLEMEEWLKLKPDFPMRSLPCLQVTNGESKITYCQSGAIAKYLARKNGLYLNLAEKNLLIEEMYDSVGDVRSALVQIHFTADNDTKKSLQEKLIKETIPKFAALFKQRMSEFGKDGYVIGSQLTLADLAVFNMVDSCIEMGMQSLWQPYKDLIKHHDTIKQIDNIAKWLKTRPKTEV